MPAPVILIHGLRTSATLWRHQVEQLEVRGIPTSAIDLPGHGRRMSERFTLEAAYASISTAVDAAHESSGEKPYLVGFSLGGYLAIEWVARNPGRVAGLLAAACGTDPGRIVLGGWRMLARIIHRFPDRGLALNNRAVRLFVPEPGATDVIAGGVALEVMDDVLVALRRIRPSRALPAVDVPVLLVNGAFDHIRLHDRRMAAATPRARVVTVPRATHMVTVIAPDVFLRHLLEGYADATGASTSSRLP